MYTTYFPQLLDETKIELHLHVQHIQLLAAGIAEMDTHPSTTSLHTGLTPGALILTLH